MHHARHVPFSAQVIVDEEEVMELLDQLRFNLPDEIKQANWTIQEQQRLIAEAHAEAARILARANENAERVVSQQEIVRRAERQAAQRLRDADARATEVTRGAEDYAREQLQTLEAHVSRILATVKRSVEALQTPAQSSEPERGEVEQAVAEAIEHH